MSERAADDDARLAAIKARRAVAKPENWRYDTGRVNRITWPDDAVFLVHAAGDIDWLIAKLEESP